MLSTPLEKFLQSKVNPHQFYESLSMTVWPANYKKKRVTFRQNQSLLSIDQLRSRMIKRFVSEGFKVNQLQNMLVQVSMYTVDWVTRSKQNFLDFSRVLKECNNPRIYQTDFIHALVDEFWTKHQEKLL